MGLDITFEAALSNLINYHSVDEALNTPDFILAESIVAELKVQRIIQQKRSAWYSPHGLVDDGHLEVTMKADREFATPDKNQLD